MENNNIITQEEILKDIRDSLFKQEIENKKEIYKNKNEKETNIDENRFEKSKNFSVTTLLIKKSFDKGVTSFSDTLSKNLNPGNLLKTFGLLTGNPLVSLLGDKVEDIISSIKEAKKEAKEEYEASKKEANEQYESTKKDMNNQYEATNRNSFLDEEIQNKKMEATDLTNDLLEQIANNTEDIINNNKDNEKESFLSRIGSIFKNPKAIFGKLLPFGGGLAGSVLSGGMRGLTKVLPKLLGKLALPVLAAFSIFDFIKGFTEDENADLKTKFDKGLSSVLSGLTFGLLSEDTIENGVKLVTDKIINLFKEPFVLLKNFIEGKISFKDLLVKNLSNITFGLIPDNFLSDGVDFVIDTLKNTFLAPFKLLGDIIEGKAKGMSFTDIIKEKIQNNPIYSFFTSDDIKSAFNSVGDYFSSLLTATIDRIKEEFTNFKLKDIFDFVLGKEASNIISNKAIDVIGKIKDDTTERINDNINLINKTKDNLMDKLSSLNPFKTNEINIDKNKNIKSIANELEPTKRNLNRAKMYREDSLKTNKIESSQVNNINNNSSVVIPKDMSTRTDDRTFNLFGL